MVVGQIEPERVAALRAAQPTLSFQHGYTNEEPVDAVFAWDRDMKAFTRLLARDSDRFRWVHFRRVGLPAPVLRLFEPHDRITLTTGSGASGPAVAEYVVAVTLALHRRLPELRDSQRRAEWIRGFTVAELRGQTVCIVGLGDLGRSIARLLRPFGVRLLGVRRGEGAVEEVDETHTVASLGDVLPRSNILILAAPLTPATRRLIGSELLGRLPRGSYLVNVGRGPLLDEAALLEALRSGQLTGAALDVFEEEPLPASSPLWSQPNVIVTPHTSTHTPQNDDRSVAIFLDNLARFQRGEALRNIVDRARGY